MFSSYKLLTYKKCNKMKWNQILIKLIIILSFILCRFNASAQAPYPKTGNDTVCAGSTKSYGIIDVQASGYQWSVSQGLSGTDWILTNTGHNTITIKWISPGIYPLQ